MCADAASSTANSGHGDASVRRAPRHTTIIETRVMAHITYAASRMGSHARGAIRTIVCGGFMFVANRSPGAGHT